MTAQAEYEAQLHELQTQQNGNDVLRAKMARMEDYNDVLRDKVERLEEDNNVLTAKVARLENRFTTAKDAAKQNGMVNPKFPQLTIVESVED